MKKPYEIETSADGDYFYVHTFREAYTAEIAQMLAVDLVNSGTQEDVVGCLIDIRGAQTVSSITDKYQFAYERARSLGLPHQWRIAFLMEEGGEPQRFIETVMRNAGYDFKVFHDESSAIDWLKEG